MEPNPLNLDSVSTQGFLCSPYQDQANDHNAIGHKRPSDRNPNMFQLDRTDRAHYSTNFGGTFQHLSTPSTRIHR